jgi:DNA-binding response OmpR family regulator
MRRFRWVSAGPITEALDLRRIGWVLAGTDANSVDKDEGEACVALVQTNGSDEDHLAHLAAITPLAERRTMLVGSVNAPESRARLLAGGFGDAVGDGTSLEELAARARRIADQAAWVPRRRKIALLELDLMSREASHDGKPLNLHPREFALLWRMAETPDEPVSKQTLALEVWRLGFLPESNSIAVHMSRLRAKLVLAGLAGLVDTVAGGYRLRRSVLYPALPAQGPTVAFAATELAPVAQQRASL